MAGRRSGGETCLGTAVGAVCRNPFPDGILSRWGALGHVRGATMADDTEKAIIYAFDQSGDVPTDLRERALGYLRDLQVRPGRLTPLRRRVVVC